MAKIAESENPTIRRMRGDLSCAVCHDLFELPKTLPCLHTFCAKCLRDSEASRRHLRAQAREDHEDKLECPVCAHGTQVSGGVGGLTTNFVYVKLVEHLQVHEKLTSSSPPECGKCVREPGGWRGDQDKPPNVSVAFCYDCQAPLCEFCRRMHKRTVDLAGHHISSLEEIRQVDLGPPQQTQMQTRPHHARSDEVLYVCHKHREPLKLYCFTCDEVICRDCVVIPKDHKEHSYEFISEVIKGERISLLACLEPLQEMRGRVTTYSNRVRACEEELDARRESGVAKVDAAVERARQLLASRHAHLTETVRRTHDVAQKELRIQQEGVEMVKGSIDSAIEFTRTTVEKGSDVEVMMYKKEILARSNTLEEMLKTSYSSFEVSVPDSADLVCDMMAVEKFGQLCAMPCVETSVAAGDGLDCPMQDEPTTFTVQAKDGRGQSLLQGGGACSAHITVTPATTGTPEDVPNTVADNQDGTYTVSYRPQFPGVNSVEVMFEGRAIKESPYEVNVMRNYTRPIGAPHTFPIPNASPWGVAMVTDEEMVVTASDCVVHVYDIRGNEVDRVRSNFTRPYGVSTDHRGHLWITDREAHMVQKFYRDDGKNSTSNSSCSTSNSSYSCGSGSGSSGHFVKLFQFGSRGINAGQFSHPRGVAVNPDNDYIYISDMKNNRIQIFKPDDPPAPPRYVEQFGAPGKTEGLFNLPAGLCFNRRGQLVVCDDHNCRLQVFDAKGQFVETLGTTPSQKGLLCSPIGIAMDFHGRYAITEFGSHCVTFLSPEGDILNCVRSVGKGYGQFIHPRGITVDSSGYVYIADNENMRIARF